MANSFLLQEDAFFLLQEDNFKIILDGFDSGGDVDVSDGGFMLMGFGT